jgi:hypothetical protein
MKKRDPRKEFDSLFQPQVNKVVLPKNVNKKKLLAALAKGRHGAVVNHQKQKCKICQKQATCCALRSGIFIHFCKEHAPEDAGRYLND